MSASEILEPGLYKKLLARRFELVLLFTTTITLAVYFFYVRLDVGGEDGVYYTPALAVRDGFFIHRQVFNQYGPVFALLQSFMMRVAHVDTVLGLRYFDAVLLAMTGVLAAFTFKRVYASSAVLCGLTTWFASAYFLSSGISAVAWPSVLSLFLSIVVLMLMIANAGQAITECPWKLTAAGVLTGLQQYVRLNLGTSTLIGIAAVLLFAGIRSKSPRPWRGLLWFSAGAIAINLVMVTWLATNDALGPFLDQSVRAPAAYYGAGGRNPGITNGEIPIEHMSRFGIMYGLPAVLVVVVAVLVSSLDLRDVRKNLIPAFGGLVSVLAAILLWNKGLATDPFKRFATVYGLVTGTAVIAPFLLAHLSSQAWHHRGNDHDEQSLLPRILVGGFAVASVIQLYPGDDPRHLYWVGLIPIIMILGEISRLTFVRNKWFVPVMVAAWTVVATVQPAIQNARIVRTEVSGGVAYDGLLVQSAQQSEISDVSSVLKFVPGNKRAVILCGDAQYATWFKRFISADRMYVTWPWQLDYPSMARVRTVTWGHASTVVLCASPNAVKEWAAVNNFVIVADKGPVAVLEKSGSGASNG